MQNSIVFFCYENDEPIEVALEPECIIFIVSPQHELMFVGKTHDKNEFLWSVRVERGGVQLFPDCKGDYEIEVYENGRLLDGAEWYKYK